MIITLDEMKNYLRVDHDDDDKLIKSLIVSSEQLCMDVARISDKKLFEKQPCSKVAVLYAVAYLYEHREEDSDLAFTIRWCRKAAEIDVTGYRVVFHGELYNITSVDHMNYKKKSLKFRWQKVRR